NPPLYLTPPLLAMAAGSVRMPCVGKTFARAADPGSMNAPGTTYPAAPLSGTIVPSGNTVPARLLHQFVALEENPSGHTTALPVPFGVKSPLSIPGVGIEDCNTAALPVFWRKCSWPTQNSSFPFVPGTGPPILPPGK